MNNSWEVFLGIDQTGAVQKDGSPKPLPVAAIYRHREKWQIESDLYLPHLNKNSVQSLIADLNPAIHFERTVILLDSVLGLPRELFPKNKTLFDLMIRAHRFSQDGKKFGAKTADAFFAQFLENTSGPPPLRECEIKADANSVFQRIPFQRNIGIGTFRSWSELGSAQQKWFSLWPIDDINKPGPWMFEAYPSYFWRTIIRSIKRDPAVLKDFLTSQKHLQVHASTYQSLNNPDMCDAIVLALSGFILNKRRKLFLAPKSVNTKKEGWILGV